MKEECIDFKKLISNNEGLLNEYISERMSEVYPEVIGKDEVLKLSKRLEKTEKDLSNVIINKEQNIEVLNQYQDAISNYYSAIQEEYYKLGIRDIVTFLINIIQA